MRRDNYELRESLERHLHLIEQKDRTIKTLQVLLLIVEYLCIPTTCTCTPVYLMVMNTGRTQEAHPVTASNGGRTEGIEEKTEQTDKTL